MRKILVIFLGTLFVIGFAGYVEAAKKTAHTWASCDKYCANYTGDRRGGHVYQYCMGECQNR